MSSSVVLKIGSKEINIFSGDLEPKNKFLKLLRKNQDIIFLIVSTIFATISSLIAYGHIPVYTSFHPMFISGWLAMGSWCTFVIGITRAIANRGCIVVRKNDPLQQTSIITL